MEKGLSEHAEVKAPDAAEANAYAVEHLHGLDASAVTWWKHKGLRSLYLMMLILFLGATTNGYDRNLLNGLKTMSPRQDCKCYWIISPYQNS
jgi:hypothetical protein